MTIEKKIQGEAITLIVSGRHDTQTAPKLEKELDTAFADSLSAKFEIAPKIANKINIVFDEIYTNIANYSKATLATISYSIESEKLRISFTDNGIPYNPITAVEPDTTLSAEERKIGGLGIFMVKKMTESMEYEYTESKNVLTLVIALN